MAVPGVWNTKPGGGRSALIDRPGAFLERHLVVPLELRLRDSSEVSPPQGAVVSRLFSRNEPDRSIRA